MARKACVAFKCNTARQVIDVPYWITVGGPWAAPVRPIQGPIQG